VPSLGLGRVGVLLRLVVMGVPVLMLVFVVLPFRAPLSVLGLALVFSQDLVPKQRASQRSDQRQSDGGEQAAA
jgi:hypothetical protein